MNEELKREESYTHCDQCLRQCPVTELQCDHGKAHYREVTGKEYAGAAVTGAHSGKESAFRRRIRERREEHK